MPLSVMFFDATNMNLRRYCFIIISVKIRYLALTESMQNVNNNVNVTMDVIVSISFLFYKTVNR